MLRKCTDLLERYNLSKKKVIKNLLNELGKGMYRCENEFGEDVILVRETSLKKVGKVREIVGNGMEVWTFQCNGFLHVKHYNEKGHSEWEEYRGRYDIT